MRTALTALALVAITAERSEALEFAGTCRGASATITMIEGIDTSRARVAAEYTRPDAISYCNYSLGRGAGQKTPSAALLNSCADKFLSDAKTSGPINAGANCQTGKLGTAAGKWVNAYSFPIVPMCGDDNNQAIAIFRLMCPSFENVEKTD